MPSGPTPRLQNLRPGHVLVGAGGLIVLKVTSAPKDGAVWTRYMRGREFSNKTGFWSISQTELNEFGFRLRSTKTKPDRWGR